MFDYEEDNDDDIEINLEDINMHYDVDSSGISHVEVNLNAADGPQVVDLTELKWVAYEEINTYDKPNFLLDTSQRSEGNQLGGTRNKKYTPIDIWNLFFKEALLNKFVVATNSFAANQRRKKKWVDVTVPELKKFIGILYNTTESTSYVPSSVYYVWCTNNYQVRDL